MGAIERMEASVENLQARAPLLLVCEHASKFMPAQFNGLGLGMAALEDHVAWDIGAHALARRMGMLLGCPLVAAPASRLLVDPNRDLEAPDLIPVSAEGAPIPGNLELDVEERAARIAAFHVPFHQAIDDCLSARPDIVALIAVHSFTPSLGGVARPWHAGILHGPDTRLAQVMIDVLARDLTLNIGRNEPYAPAQGVYYTMERHGVGRATVMIEVRNDLIRDEIGQTRWAQRLAEAVSAALSALERENGQAGSGAIGRS